MLNFLIENRWRAAVCGLLLAFTQLSCSAQTTNGAENQTASKAEQPIPPTILKELEAMRQRIDELEAELKAQKLAEQSSGQPGLVTAAFPAKSTGPETVSASSSQEAAMATAKIAAPATAPAKVEPFSDADWTWLNGNPRTKEIFWDTKFFTPEIRADTNYVIDFNHPTDHSIGG